MASGITPHSLGWEQHKSCYNELLQYNKKVKEMYVWIDEVLTEAKKTLATNEIRLLPKMPSAIKTRSRIPSQRTRKESSSLSTAAAGRTLRSSRLNSEQLIFDEQEVVQEPKKSRRKKKDVPSDEVSIQNDPSAESENKTRKRACKQQEADKSDLVEKRMKIFDKSSDECDGNDSEMQGNSSIQLDNKLLDDGRKKRFAKPKHKESAVRLAAESVNMQLDFDENLRLEEEIKKNEQLMNEKIAKEEEKRIRAEVEEKLREEKRQREEIEEKFKELEDRLKEEERRRKEMEQRTIERERQILEERAKEEERQRKELEERAREEERQRKELEERAKEEERQRKELEERAKEEERQRKELEERAKEEERQRKELEERAKEKERQRKEFEERAKEEERQRKELEERAKEEERQRKEFEERAKEEERQRKELEERAKEEERQRKEFEERAKEEEKQRKEFEERAKEEERQRKELEERAKEEERQRKEFEERAKEEERQRKEFEERAKEEERQRKELEERAKEEERQRMELEERVKEEERQRKELEEKAKEEERQRKELKKRVKEEERKRKDLEKKAQEKERQRKDSEKQAEEEKKRKEFEEREKEEEKQRKELEMKAKEEELQRIEQEIEEELQRREKEKRTKEQQREERAKAKEALKLRIESEKDLNERLKIELEVLAKREEYQEKKIEERLTIEDSDQEAARFSVIVSTNSFASPLQCSEERNNSCVMEDEVFEDCLQSVDMATRSQSHLRNPSEQGSHNFQSCSENVALEMKDKSVSSPVLCSNIPTSPLKHSSSLRPLLQQTLTNKFFPGISLSKTSPVKCMNSLFLSDSRDSFVINKLSPGKLAQTTLVRSLSSDEQSNQLETSTNELTCSPSNTKSSTNTNYFSNSSMNEPVNEVHSSPVKRFFSRVKSTLGSLLPGRKLTGSPMSSPCSADQMSTTMSPQVNDAVTRADEGSDVASVGADTLVDVEMEVDATIPEDNQVTTVPSRKSFVHPRMSLSKRRSSTTGNKTRMGRVRKSNSRPKFVAAIQRQFSCTSGRGRSIENGEETVDPKPQCPPVRITRSKMRAPVKNPVPDSDDEIVGDTPKAKIQNTAAKNRLETLPGSVTSLGHGSSSSSVNYSTPTKQTGRTHCDSARIKALKDMLQSSSNSKTNLPLKPTAAPVSNSATKSAWSNAKRQFMMMGVNRGAANGGLSSQKVGSEFHGSTSGSAIKPSIHPSSFLNSFKRNELPANMTTSSTTFLPVPLIPKKLTPEEIREQKQKELELKKQKLDDAEQRKAEQKLRKAEELKRKREEKQQMAENRRKLLEQKEQEQKMAAAKKVEELAKTGSRMLQEKEKEEKEKQKLREKRMADAESRRKQDEETRLQQLLQQEKERELAEELARKAREQETQERHQRLVDQRRQEELKRQEQERERRAEQERLRLVEEQKLKEEGEKQRQKEERERREKSEREKQDLERQRERDRQKELEIQKAKELAKQQLHSKLAEDQSHAEEEKRSKDHQRAMQTAIEKHNSKLNCSSIGIVKGASSADALVDKTCVSTASTSVVRSQDGPSTSHKSNPDSYKMSPVKLANKATTSENYDIANLHSDDSTDDESKPRKRIPSWADGSKLKLALINQYVQIMNPDSIFGPIYAPDLHVMFTKSKPRFNKRTSSAVWDVPLLPRPNHR